MRSKADDPWVSKQTIPERMKADDPGSKYSVDDPHKNKNWDRPLWLKRAPAFAPQDCRLSSGSSALDRTTRPCLLNSDMTQVDVT